MISYVHGVLLWMIIQIVMISLLILHLIVIDRFHDRWMAIDSILVIMYDTQACIFGTVILLMDKSLLVKSYSNCLSLSSMLGESIFCSNP